MILFSSSVVHVTVMIRLELQNILLTNGLRSEIFKQVVELIELLQMETEEFLLLMEKVVCKSLLPIINN